MSAFGFKEKKKSKHLGKRSQGLFSSVTEGLKEGRRGMQFGIRLVVPFRAFPAPNTCLLADSSRWKQKASSPRTSLRTRMNLESVSICKRAFRGCAPRERSLDARRGENGRKYELCPSGTGGAVIENPGTLWQSKVGRGMKSQL